MSKEENGREYQIGTLDGENERELPAGIARLVSSVTFGLGAAVLAGIVIVPGPAAPVHAATGTAIVAPVYITTSLGAPINESAACTTWITTQGSCSGQ